MAGTKINEATLRETLQGTESIPIVDTDLPKGRVTAEKLKEYVQPDLNDKADKVTVVDHGTNDTTFALTPNVFHKWGEVATLDLTLASETSGVLNEYMFQFTSGTTPTVLTLPETVNWIGDSIIEASKTYQVSMVKNLAILGGA